MDVPIIKEGKARSLISLGITILILALIIYLGSTRGINLSLTGFSVFNPEKGQNTTVTASIDFEDDESVGSENLEFHLNGPVYSICRFNLSGSVLSGCNGIYIKKTSDTTHNYGYGFGNGTLTYNITISTTNFLPGNYTADLRLYFKNQTYSSLTENFSVSSNLVTNLTSYNHNSENSSLNLSSLHLQVNSAGSGNVAIASFSDNPTGETQGVALGKWFEIDSDYAVKENLSQVIIKIYYTEEEISSAGVQESSLRIYYFNQSSNEWMIYEGLDGGVDTTENYVWAITNHFSVWGVFGSSVGGGGGGGGGSGGGGGITGTVSSLINRIVCQASWNCTEWGECIGGNQTRICIDLSSCNTTTDKPEEEKVCSLENAPENTTENTGEDFGSKITGKAIEDFTEFGSDTAMFLIVLLVMFNLALIFTLKRVLDDFPDSTNNNQHY